MSVASANNDAAWFQAISTGDVACCGRMLLSGFNVDTTQKRWTGLLIAAWNGNVSLVNLLLKYKANINAQQSDGSTPVYIACQKGFTDLVKLLLAHKADISIARNCGATPLYICAQEGRFTEATLLLQSGASPNTMRHDGSHAFYIACRNNHLQVAEALVKYKADVNLPHPSNGATGLYVACQERHMEIIKFLLQVPAVDVNQSTSSGHSPLHVAALTSNVYIMQLLLDNGATLDRQNCAGEVCVFFCFDFSDTRALDTTVVCSCEKCRSIGDLSAQKRSGSIHSNCSYFFMSSGSANVSEYKTNSRFIDQTSSYTSGTV